MELAAIGAFVAGMTGGAVGSFAGGWVERGRYRRQWEDQLIPAAREFAAATRELVRAEQAHGRDSIPKDVADAWTERHQALVPVEHHLPMMLQTIMNSPVVSAKDDGTRWALLNKIADYLDEEWQLLAARQQRSAWDRLPETMTPAPRAALRARLRVTAPWRRTGPHQSHVGPTSQS